MYSGQILARKMMNANSDVDIKKRSTWAILVTVLSLYIPEAIPSPPQK